MATRAQGFEPVKQFAHKGWAGMGQVESHQTRQAQSTVTSPWGRLMVASRKVDVARVNWPGLIGVQRAAGMYDPTPRLIKGQRVVAMPAPVDLLDRVYVRCGSGVGV